MNLVSRIKEKCTEKGTTIKKLEREIGLGNGTISRWDTSIPSYDKVIKVADFLQVSFYWLIFGKEAEDLTPEEQQLVNYYRQSDDRGKRNILRTAQAESGEETSSISGNG
ncbi:MAG: helix-turn-helix domain-containing protein [Butyrivibrio sp.]|nr:helix-turn-helix domain-containing protein [Butyrivibrio sp.]